jgi:predicted dinucleotide-binding enzyme
MHIAILGSGLMGGKLGTLFIRAGHEVTFAYARDPKKLKRLAKSAGPKARAGTVAEAVRDADAVLLAVHWSKVDDVLAQAGDLAGMPVFNCSLPMNDDETALVIGHTTSGAETLQAKLPKAHVVSAFGSVPSEVFFSVFAARKKKSRPDLVLCGDHAPAKRKAAALIRDIGFNPVDVGALKVARTIEPFTLVVAQIAYETKGGPQVAYRFERFKDRP